MLGAVLLAVVLSGCSSSSGGEASGPGIAGAPKNPVESPASGGKGGLGEKVLYLPELKGGLLTAAELGAGWKTYVDDGDDGNPIESGSPLDLALKEQCPVYRENPDYDQFVHEVEGAVKLVAPAEQSDPEAKYDLEVEVYQNPADQVGAEIEADRKFMSKCSEVKVSGKGGKPDTRIIMKSVQFKELGDGTSAWTMSMKSGSKSTTQKTVVTRIGNTVIEVTGGPMHVDRYAEQAVSKVRSVLK
jgi:hypothetical protein